MPVELACLITATIASGVLAVIISVGRWRAGRPLPYRGLMATSFGLADVWLWQIALSSVFGPQRWLIIPLLAVNVVLAFGGIFSSTGLRMHDDGATLGGGTMGMFLGRDASMVANGFDRDNRN